MIKRLLINIPKYTLSAIIHQVDIINMCVSEHVKEL